ncbi:peptide chain release factor N(5)-glutamine methyltransferase [Undibacter mobilis]|uniref:Release factor glutamine methyltransferase n=1 Tax=Undibacter mobilis TaxID=2292256 RepID=A0A371B8F3_9BRAD|nr:peptide chain release factor N(5)-glutamine methyltransferase [Undibacter mobilis]RDV03834.1 peptide chain release factor N(5)-glutamine methyltransferase [Undibacter mobilis]
MLRVISGLKADASVAEAQRLMVQTFRLGGIESPDADARLLLGHALRLDRAQLLAQSDRLLEAREVACVQALAARRINREPVSRILGRKEFWSLTLHVSDAVLVPRPETETIVEQTLDRMARDSRQGDPLRILDIGTGSGALLLALLSEFKNATGVGTDISMAAIEVARGNAERNKLDGRARFVCCSLADGLSGPFDLVVSNPPYIARAEIATLDPEVRDYDPVLALDGGADGLDFYRAIAREADRLLVPGGHLVVELGAGQEAAVSSLFETVGLKVAPAQPDLAGIPRALGAQKG